MDRIASYNVARKYEKRSLLILINAVAGLSIFFFGYDQGVMGGVNTNRNYAETMGFGAWDDVKQEVAVSKPLLKGGIVSTCSYPLETRALRAGLGEIPEANAPISFSRSLSTISPVHSSAPSSVAGSVTDMEELRPSP